MEGKQTRGRQRIEIKRIDDTEARLVTFSKRKAGILKKASELSNLCGAEVGTVLYSPAGKAFSFAYPSIEVITNRFLNREMQIIGADATSRVEIFGDRHNELHAKLAIEKEKAISLKKITNAIKQGNMTNNIALGWWEKPIEQLSISELEKVASNMEQFYSIMNNYIDSPSNVASLGSMLQMVNLAPNHQNHLSGNNDMNVPTAGPSSDMLMDFERTVPF